MARTPSDLDDLVEHWTLLKDEQGLVSGKRGATRLGFAVLLKFYQRRPEQVRVELLARRRTESIEPPTPGRRSASSGTPSGMLIMFAVPGSWTTTSKRSTTHTGTVTSGFKIVDVQ
ncbi:hypothetical protein [Streptomyces sp. ID05-47C]|uniref:hypothetical protein n=1 Tax=Streptomyces sp. ID05-47C TaxID=3028665 RepID=UPI0029BC1FE5|nr:hypothetical protein [Streptomyces sp. ID05-47C]MDX3570188.1 hypothetical protein [Streptomyces sp. ID05-47C]